MTSIQIVRSKNPVRGVCAECGKGRTLRHAKSGYVFRGNVMTMGFKKVCDGCAGVGFTQKEFVWIGILGMGFYGYYSMLFALSH